MKTFLCISLAMINIIGISYLDFTKIQTPDDFVVGFIVLCIIFGNVLTISLGIQEVNQETPSNAFMGFIISLKILPALYIFVQSFANRQFLFVYIYLCFISVSIFFSIRENKKPSPS